MTVSEVRERALRVMRATAHARATLSAGGLAYFVALSLAPAALAVGAIAGLLLTPDQVRTALDALVTRLPALAPVLPAVQGVVSTVTSASAASVTLTSVVGLLLAVWAASNVAVGVRRALVPIYGGDISAGGFAVRVMAAVGTLVVLVIGAALVVLAALLPRLLAFLNVDASWLVSSPLLSTLALLVLVLMVSRVVLRRAGGLARGWRSPGPPIVAVWVLAVTAGLGLYVSMSTSLSAAMAVFGSLVVVLLWLYLCFLGLLVGAVLDAEV